MQRALSSARALARPLRTAAPSSIRTISSTPRRFSDHHAPPSLLGEGAKPGTVPTDQDQSTGLERLQVLGHMDGIDVFDMQPLEVLKLGTKADPILIKSLDVVRQVGCTGYPVDSHDTIWLNVTKAKEFHRCPECGSVYKLDYQGPDLTHHHH